MPSSIKTYVQLLCGLTLAGGVSSAFAQTGPNLALGKPVVGGSGSWQGAAPGGNPYDIGQFSAPNVTTNTADSDGDPTNDSPMFDPQDTGGAVGAMWLGKEADLSEDFVIDFVTSIAFQSFSLVNTHNAQFDDRSTGVFEIYGSNAVVPRIIDETGDGGVDLLNPVLLASGSLAFQGIATDPVDPESFPSASATPYRYIRFNALSMAGPQVGGFFGVGLNEFRAFAVPEPGSTLLTVLSLSTLFLRRRRQPGSRR
ncbi:MAG: PEP-CTERM sorting domain-containing protein [Verrucomicrobiales bacterium]